MSQFRNGLEKATKGMETVRLYNEVAGISLLTGEMSRSVSYVSAMSKYLMTGQPMFTLCMHA